MPLRASTSNCNARCSEHFSGSRRYQPISSSRGEPFTSSLQTGRITCPVSFLARLPNRIPRPLPDPSEAPQTLAMATSRLGFLLSHLIVSVLIVSPALASSDAPFMVAHKKVSLSRLKSGVERVSVSIDLYNEGSATAYDVSLSDDGWSQDMFTLVSGNMSKTWERLDAGSTASHSFVLEAKVKGMFHGSPAVIKFRVTTKAALQEAYSTPILPLDILAERPPEKKFEWAKRLAAKHGSLVSVLLLVALFIYLIATPSKSSAAKASKKRR
ncbi:putative translocon-associated protein subunit beta [Cocos nucifera]|uniref:Putative translocon-associated protein subunit beta n=1 Tax=Cocos nucifera TaxID=13894 RepID=A0A8K0MXK9_COCNU|nr:putative translocon-associated protein subunit beta [Cocos nucifera]